MHNRRIEGRHETREPNTQQPGRITNFWRHYCNCCCPDPEMVGGVSRPVTTPEHRRDSTEGDKPSIHLTALVTDHASGWNGSSSETLRGLLQEVVKLNMRQHNNANDLHENIYNLHLLNTKQQGFTDRIKDEDYQTSLQKVHCPENIRSRPQELQEGQWGGYLYFTRRDSTTQSKDGITRVTLNIQPDYIPAVTEHLVKKMARSVYIPSIKVASTADLATQSLSNIIIYLHLSGSGDTEDLIRTIEQYVRYTRPGNPAMMQTLAFRGMAIAEEREDGSFGDTHVKPIVEAITALQAKGKNTDNVDTLLEEVKEQFKAHGIDPEKPHLNLPKGDPKGKRKAVSTEA